MFIVEEPTWAIILCLVTMLCWGSWGNGQKWVTQSAPLYIFYRDYVYGIAGSALMLAFTLGTLGDEGRPLLEDIRQAEITNLLLALAAGIIFNLGNTLLTVGINQAGLSIAMPVGTGLSLALGLVVNHIAEPSGNLPLLAAGGGVVLVAIALSALAYRAKEKEEEDDEESSSGKNRGVWIALSGGLALGFFFVIVSSAMSKELASPEAGLLTPYSGFLFFALGILISNPGIEWLVRHFKISDEDDETKYGEVPARQHAVGLASGVLWGVGMIALFLGSPEAGDAVSYGLSQGATIVSVLWGLFAWAEFEGAPKKANRFLWFMGIAYVAGLALIILARA
ncbi:GRP family sugar transporter [Rhabdobacter roseus]|uniref:Glucose uptake protein n=1 Tax=Rhabdobacter roseus TaxID=1655419 RepID=A0A840TTN6_9BACT|nr:GRP family sugar transporter [Rhabdobacter roseus]MBB5284633.1 glucose uptake protein [Rhabdobacter roseus]